MYVLTRDITNLFANNSCKARCSFFSLDPNLQCKESLKHPNQARKKEREKDARSNLLSKKKMQEVKSLER